MSTNVNVDLYFCDQCFEVFMMNCVLLHIRHGSANFVSTSNTFSGGNYIVFFTVCF